MNFIRRNMKFSRSSNNFSRRTISLSRRNVNFIRRNVSILREKNVNTSAFEHGIRYSINPRTTTQQHCNHLRPSSLRVRRLAMASNAAPWKDSKAKEVLSKLIISGFVPDSMTAKEVYNDTRDGRHLLSQLTSKVADTINVFFSACLPSSR
jgi:hypothetical protein